MAKEYIEREKALEKVIEVKHHDPELSGVVLHRYIKEIDLKNIPAADVVEVVRCKDCIRRGTEDCAMYWDTEDCAMRYGCEYGEQHTWETDNDFCSWGERRDNE